MNIIVKTYFDHLLLSELSSDQKSDFVRNNIQSDLKDVFLSIQEEEKDLFYGITLLPDILPSHSLIEDRPEIITIVQDTVLQCNKLLPRSKDLYIIITPTFYSEYIQELGGVMGFAPRSGNSIFVALNTSPKTWRHNLKSTIAHEYHHTIIHEHQQQWQTFEDVLVYEGLAEHFRDQVIGGNPSPWAISDTEDQKYILSYWHYFANRLHNNVFDENSGYYEYFVGEDPEVPDYLGYSLGYMIISQFLKHHPYTIQEVTFIKPQIILQWWMRPLQEKKD